MSMQTQPITNHDDVIDSRDVTARIEYLTDLGTEADDDEQAELATLQALAAEGANCAADWPYGEVLVRNSYFVEYAQQLAEDLGCINPDASWPNTCIDWEQAARELRYDYTPLDFDGVTYWIRN